MKDRIYLEDSPLALKAEQECNELAKTKGYNSWNEWYSKELETGELVSKLESFKEMMNITKKYWGI